MKYLYKEKWSITGKSHRKHVGWTPATLLIASLLYYSSFLIVTETQIPLTTTIYSLILQNYTTNKK